MLQTTALKVLKSGQNVFLTGSAGAGKTYLLNQYIDYLHQHGVATAVTASTGIAATHINGQTIHSWSGLGIKESITAKDLEKIAKNKPRRMRLEAVQVLIIDEISMLSGQSLAGVETILKHFKKNFEPFGGVQVVLCGDFFQLPPVSQERKPSHECLAFMHPVWVESRFSICYLTEQYRSDDSALTTILNEMRSGDITDSSQDLLYEKLKHTAENPPEDHLIRLYTHNADVEIINHQQLEKIRQPARDYFAQSKGDKQRLALMKKSIMAPECLSLKLGASVMFVKNNFDLGYSNGTLGTVTGFSAEGWPEVTTFDDRLIVAKPLEWGMVNELNQKIATFTQIPLRLAWAITVHKSQGMTLDGAAMDLSKTFEPGQGYVAMSRVKNWSGLRLLGCNHNALIIDPLVGKADRRFQELAAECEADYQAIDEPILAQNHKQFLFQSGGTLDPNKVKTNQARAQVLLEPKKKISTYTQTKTLIEQGLDLRAIAAERNLGVSTIINHLVKLKKDFPDLDIEKFRPGKATLDRVKKAEQTLKAQAIKEDYDSDGQLKLGLLHRQLAKNIGYETLRLTRLFL